MELLRVPHQHTAAVVRSPPATHFPAQLALLENVIMWDADVRHAFDRDFLIVYASHKGTFAGHAAGNCFINAPCFLTFHSRFGPVKKQIP